MNTKKSKVKSYFRKGKLVKSFDRNVKTIFLSKDKQGKNKLTTTSKVILGIGGLAALGIGGKKLLISTNSADNKVVNEIMKKSGEAQKNIYKKAYEMEKASMSPAEKAEDLREWGEYFKAKTRSTSSASGADFLDLRNRRLAKNQEKFSDARKKIESIDDNNEKVTYQIYKDSQGLPTWNAELGVRNPKIYNRKERKRLAGLIIEKAGGKKSTGKRKRDNNFSLKKLITFNY